MLFRSESHHDEAVLSLSVQRRKLVQCDAGNATAALHTKIVEVMLVRMRMVQCGHCIQSGV
jgi:hypothetical protein